MLSPHCNSIKYNEYCLHDLYQNNILNISDNTLEKLKELTVNDSTLEKLERSTVSDKNGKNLGVNIHIRESYQYTFKNMSSNKELFDLLQTIINKNEKPKYKYLLYITCNNFECRYTHLLLESGYNSNSEKDIDYNKIDKLRNRHRPIVIRDHCIY